MDKAHTNHPGESPEKAKSGVSGKEAASGVLPDKYVITVGRSFGSGGREIGEKIASRLGIPFYDKRLLLSAAGKSGLSPECFEQNDEKSPSLFTGLFSYNMGYSPYSWYSGATPASSESIYSTICGIILDLYDKGPCVIVGRTADHVLRDKPAVVNVFIHAPAEECAKRIIARGDAKTPREAIALAEKTNKLRANFYNFYSEKKWGEAKSYHLCVDSSSASTDDLAELIISYIKLKLAK